MSLLLASVPDFLGGLAVALVLAAGRRGVRVLCGRRTGTRPDDGA